MNCSRPPQFTRQYFPPNHPESIRRNEIMKAWRAQCGGNIPQPRDLANFISNLAPFQPREINVPPRQVRGNRIVFGRGFNPLYKK